jgi:hypothetical protein
MQMTRRSDLGWLTVAMDCGLTETRRTAFKELATELDEPKDGYLALLFQVWIHGSTSELFPLRDR